MSTPLDYWPSPHVVDTRFTGGRKRDRVACGAKTRKGTPCARRAVEGKARCPNHGGLSTGPKTPEGRAKALLNLRLRHKPEVDAA